MSKYIDAEKLKAEIERLYDGEAPKHDQQCDFDDGYFTGIEAISRFIDSHQQEQPELDFKIEERKWIHDAVDNVFPEDGDFMSEVDFRKILKDTARHFYTFGKNTRKEE